MSLLVLSAKDVDKVVSKFTPNDLVNLMAQVFGSFSSMESPSPLDLSLPHRLNVPTINHSALFMPSRITPFGTAMKVVSVPTVSAPPEIKQKGLPGSTLLLDDETGAVKAIINASNLTALRNAAGSLLSAQLLLRADSSPQTIIAFGAGAQISAHLTLFLQFYPTITNCKVINRSINERVTLLIESLTVKFPNVKFESIASSTAMDSNSNLKVIVQSANIIITATSSRTPLFSSDYVSPGTHLCLIGSYTPEMHEIDIELVNRGGVILVDSREACKIEAGEFIDAGVTKDDNKMIEIGELVELKDPKDNKSSWSPVTSKIDKIKAGGDVTIFKSVGVGIQDVAIAYLVAETAAATKVGTVVDL
ncbi:NAD-P-binding protein [Abortiporus biennis]|nr:NAD-P-binding protein [Abortiporus biennis]